MTPIATVINYQRRSSIFQHIKSSCATRNPELEHLHKNGVQNKQRKKKSSPPNNCRLLTALQGSTANTPVSQNPSTASAFSLSNATTFRFVSAYSARYRIPADGSSDNTHCPRLNPNSVSAVCASAESGRYAALDQFDSVVIEDIFLVYFFFFFFFLVVKSVDNLKGASHSPLNLEKPRSHSEIYDI